MEKLTYWNMWDVLHKKFSPHFIPKTRTGILPIDKTTYIPKIEKGFHAYAAEWDPERIAFFLDGINVYTFAPKERTASIWPFDQPLIFYLN